MQTGCARARAHPSLALIKYWGKANAEQNIPATPSLAITLGGLSTHTTVRVFQPSGKMTEHSQPEGEQDYVFIRNVRQPVRRFEPFFSNLRRELAKERKECPFRFLVESVSDFPESAGLASSSSGFAALTAAACSALNWNISARRMSALARQGSASAARCFWGGFVQLDAGAAWAEPAAPENWWPELRVIAVMTSRSPKSMSSRAAMEHCRETSSYYPEWLRDSGRLMSKALEALQQRSLDTLGPLMRQSYSSMFATMLSANPPVLYWNPLSVEILRLCETLRSAGFSVWETMDAGPQVKIICEENSVPEVIRKLQSLPVQPEYRISSAGGPPRVESCE